MTERAQLPRSWSTRRLKLRLFRLADVDDVLAYATDEEWARFLPVPMPYKREHAESFIASQILADHSSAPRWALEQSDVIVGSVELALDHEVGVASLHYSIARPLWGQGLMTEAVHSVLDRAFLDLPHIMRVSAWADTRNEASWRVMEKVGLSREGVFRSCRVVHDERVDDVRYALVRPDWAPLRKQ